jgi:hypothetical protein
MRTLLIPLALLALGGAASADEVMRCGDWVIAMPISLEELRDKCGEPAKKDVTTEDVRTGAKSGHSSQVVGSTTTEKWTYRPSTLSLPMVVTIVDGQVTRIERER